MLDLIPIRRRLGIGPAGSATRGDMGAECMERKVEIVEMLELTEAIREIKTC